ncbi:MAG: LamG domain-containing protein [Kiritimatiellia bacterium]
MARGWRIGRGPGAIRAVAAGGIALLAMAASARVVSYPAEGNWGSFRIVPGGGWIWIDRADGSHVGFVGATPDGEKYTRYLVVSNSADCLHIDARAAFAAGADGVTLYTADLPLDLASGNDSLTGKVTWQGPCGLRMRDILIGERTDGSGWNEGFEYTAGYRRRRTTEHTFAVPAVRKVYHRIDILDPGGGDGHPDEFRLYGIRTGDYAELATPRPVRRPPRLLFAASFDEGLAAETAGGEARPVRTNAVTRVPGKRGMAVRLSQSARSTLGWKAGGNVDPVCGTLAFWFRKNWKSSDAWRTLFFCPGADVRGGGTIDFWYLNDTLRLDRHDLDHWHEYILPEWIPPDRQEWNHYVFTWDEEATKFYVNGRAVPDWADKTRADDYSPLRAALADVDLHRFDRRKRSFANFYLGSKADGSCAQDGDFDELKVWSGAMTPAEVRRMAKAEGVRTEASPPAVTVGANPYEGPTNAVPGTIANRRRVRTIRPAADVFAAAQFASVGTTTKKTLGGVGYLEAGTRANDRFAIRLALDAAKPLYLIEVDYPDDAVRTAEFLVQRSQRSAGDYTLQSGVFCGAEYPVSHTIRTERYVYWTSAADATFIATTLRANEPAAVAEIRLYEVVDGRLPAACPPAAVAASVRFRHFVSYWEDPAFAQCFAAPGATPAALAATIDRFAAYMKFCGQDVLSFPACFYGGRIGADGYDPRQLAPGHLEAFYRKFDAEGLLLVPSINQQVVPTDTRAVTRTAMLDGSLHPTAIAIHGTGKPNWGGWHGTPPNFNVAHPEVRQAFVDEVRRLAQEGKPHPSFQGVALHLAMVNPLWFGSIECGYNDYCIEAFEREMKVKVRGEGEAWRSPLRGKMYYESIVGDQELYAQWVDWRCDVVTDFYATLAQTLAAARSDLRLWINVVLDWPPDAAGFGTEAHRLRTLREAGIDPGKIAARVPGAVLGLTGYPANWRRWVEGRCDAHGLSASVRAQARDWSVSPRHFATIRGAASPWAHFHDTYWENAVGARRVGADVLSNAWLDETAWRVSALHPCGAHALASFAAALAGADAQVLSCGGFLVGTLGFEPELAAFMREYRKLPAVRFADLPAPEGYVLRTAVAGGRRWTYRLKLAYPYTLEVRSQPIAREGNE